MNTTLTIATRQSPLALWQADEVRRQLKKYHPQLDVQLKPMTTQGDRILDTSLRHTRGKGLFLKELEHALLTKEADIAVHSMKDVPALLPSGLTIETILPRSNPFDAFISNQYSKLSQFPDGAIIGTTSLRRQSQLLALRPNIQIEPLRGNINTRLDKLDQGQFDAIILAVAGIKRLALTQRKMQIFSAQQILPAPGQGVIGIECRIDDERVKSLLAPLHDVATGTVVRAERAVSEALNGGCQTPVSAFATLENPQEIYIRARVCSADGQKIFQGDIRGPQIQAFELGKTLAKELLEQGAQQILAKLSI